MGFSRDTAPKENLCTTCDLDQFPGNETSEDHVGSSFACLGKMEFRIVNTQ